MYALYLSRRADFVCRPLAASIAQASSRFPDSPIPASSNDEHCLSLQTYLAPHPPSCQSINHAAMRLIWAKQCSHMKVCNPPAKGHCFPAHVQLYSGIKPIPRDRPSHETFLLLPPKLTSTPAAAAATTITTATTAAAAISTKKPAPKGSTTSTTAISLWSRSPRVVGLCCVGDANYSRLLGFKVVRICAVAGFRGGVAEAHIGCAQSWMKPKVN